MIEKTQGPYTGPPPFNKERFTKHRLKVAGASFLGLVFLAALTSPETDHTSELVVSQSSTTTTTQPRPTTTEAPATTTTKAPTTTTTRAPETTTTTAFSQSDAARYSRGACEHFRNVAGDIAEVRLTPEEMRKKFKEIDRDALIGTPAVQAAAAELVKAGTLFQVAPSSGTAQGILDASTQMDAACDEAGH